MLVVLENHHDFGANCGRKTKPQLVLKKKSTTIKLRVLFFVRKIFHIFGRVEVAVKSHKSWTKIFHRTVGSAEDSYQKCP